MERKKMSTLIVSEKKKITNRKSEYGKEISLSFRAKLSGLGCVRLHPPGRLFRRSCCSEKKNQQMHGLTQLSSAFPPSNVSPSFLLEFSVCLF